MNGLPCIILFEFVSFFLFKSSIRFKPPAAICQTPFYKLNKQMGKGFLKGSEKIL